MREHLKIHFEKYASTQKERPVTPIWERSQFLESSNIHLFCSANETGRSQILTNIDSQILTNIDSQILTNIDIDKYRLSNFSTLKLNLWDHKYWLVKAWVLNFLKSLFGIHGLHFGLSILDLNVVFLPFDLFLILDLC